MAVNSADANERATIRRLAMNSARVRVTRTAEYDLLAHHLTTADICVEIIAAIDGGMRIKKVTLRGQHAGQAAFEIKPRLMNMFFYIKVTVCDAGGLGEYLLIVSAHPEH